MKTIVTTILEKTKKSCLNLQRLDSKSRDAFLSTLAEKILISSELILAENKKDLSLMDKNDPKYDRLKLTTDRINDITKDIKNVSTLNSPIGEEYENRALPNGLVVKKRKVPIGIVGVIYESRPNVTLDVFSLCFKTANACVLKGGSDAHYTNSAIIKIIKSTLNEAGIDSNIVNLLPAEREATQIMLKATDYVDLIIPRGSQNLINYVRDNSTVPVIETGAGVVHTYFDSEASLKKGVDIINNSKTRRVSVCNALDCLVIHKERLSDLPVLVSKLSESGVTIFADNASQIVLNGKYPDELLKKACENSFGMEFLDYKMSIKTVDNIDEAIKHVSKYSSKHSEAIVSENSEHIDKYINEVDAAVVYSNTSTAFTDGAQFGLGAEIGISTQKLHARGPMALNELTTYKWIVLGNGQIRT